MPLLLLMLEGWLVRMSVRVPCIGIISLDGGGFEFKQQEVRERIGGQQHKRENSNPALGVRRPPGGGKWGWGWQQQRTSVWHSGMLFLQQLWCLWRGSLPRWTVRSRLRRLRLIRPWGKGAVTCPPPIPGSLRASWVTSPNRFLWLSPIRTPSGSPGSQV